MKKLGLLLTSIAFSMTSMTASAGSAGWSEAAEIERIELIKGLGALIIGPFGNASNCGTANALWLPKSHVDYDQIYTTALAAHMSSTKVRAYTSGVCSNTGFYSDMYNTVGDNFRTE